MAELPFSSPVLLLELLERKMSLDAGVRDPPWPKNFGPDDCEHALQFIADLVFDEHLFNEHVRFVARAYKDVQLKLDTRPADMRLHRAIVMHGLEAPGMNIAVLATLVTNPYHLGTFRSVMNGQVCQWCPLFRERKARAASRNKWQKPFDPQASIGELFDWKRTMGGRSPADPDFFWPGNFRPECEEECLAHLVDLVLDGISQDPGLQSRFFRYCELVEDMRRAHGLSLHGPILTAPVIHALITKGRDAPGFGIPMMMEFFTNHVQLGQLAQELQYKPLSLWCALFRERKEFADERRHANAPSAVAVS